ncbi:MAG: DUF115 domain-containing protein [Spirochaetaceae bacterium]|jgi:hypothetical protein|nr:DUF115 domain-containing protein [Spirochaetaceae bacterium]
MNTFEQNLAALFDRDPELADRLSRVKIDHKRYVFFEARSGDIVPGLIGGNKATHPLHSLVDPVHEANRLIGADNDKGFLVFIGLGGGFSVTAALERGEVQHILVIEYDIAGLAELLSSLPYHRIFKDPRFHILVDPSNEAIESHILGYYHPIISGGIRLISLRTRVAGQPCFNKAFDAANSAINKVRADYSVQAHFGVRWFSNILRNLIRAEKQDEPIPRIKRAAITAAGPSLDLQLPQLAQKRREFFLLATDTSLQSLLQAGIEPDGVVSIDCQHISYYHFMLGLPAHIPLYLGLVSPPLVASRSERLHFFAEGHPFTQYISRYWRYLPLLDTSGGNVTYAALSLADMLGAEQIELYGADFSYPQGRSYSRGSYMYLNFEARQHRFSPAESLFSAFLFRNPILDRIDAEDTWYYETDILTRYRNLLEEKISFLRSEIVPVKGLGAVITVKPKRTDSADPMGFFAPGKPSMPAGEFLREYREKLRRLPDMRETPWSYRAGLSSEDIEVFTTLLPASAAIKNRHPQVQDRELLEIIKEYCIKEIDGVLKSL